MKFIFKGKVKESRYTDGTLARRYISVPVVARHHLDMNEARQHPKYGPYANSVIFAGMVKSALCKAGIRKDCTGKLWVELPPIAELPPAVTVDESGFLAVVTVDIG